MEQKSWKGHPLPARAVAKIATYGFSTCSCYLYKLGSLYIRSVLSRQLDEICILSLISHLTSFLHGHRPPRLERWVFRSHPSTRGLPSSLLYYKENHGMRKYQYLNDFENRLFKWSFYAIAPQKIHAHKGIQICNQYIVDEGNAWLQLAGRFLLAVLGL